MEVTRSSKVCLSPDTKRRAVLIQGCSPIKNLRIRACADRLVTFHVCRFSERSNRLLIDH